MSLMGAGGVSLKKVQSLIDSAVSTVNSKISTLNASVTSVSNRVKTLEGKHPVAKLLWTNSKSTSSFGSQTVSVSLSAYTFVVIIFRNQAGAENAVFGQVFPISGRSMAFSVAKDTGAVLRRFMNITSTGISFENATYDANSGNNNLLVPWKIYGLDVD